MKTIRKVWKIGNSIGITGLPKTFSPGDLVVLEENGDGAVTIRKAIVTPVGGEPRK